MIKRLTPIGNSLGIIVERSILKLLGIDRDTPLEVKTDGESLIIRPIRKDHRERIRESAGRMMDIHDETLTRLAE